MFERGFRAAAAHRASDLKLSPPPRRDLMKPVLEELWRSLRAERRQVTTTDDAVREMASALNETGDWVLGGGGGHREGGTRNSRHVPMPHVPC